MHIEHDAGAFVLKGRGIRVASGKPFQVRNSKDLTRPNNMRFRGLPTFGECERNKVEGAKYCAAAA